MEENLKPGFDPVVLQNQLTEGMFEKVQTDYDIRNEEIKIRKIKAYAELEKIKVAYHQLNKVDEQLELEREKLKLEREKFEAQKVKDLYYICTDYASKTDKQLQRISKLKLGLFPELDKQVVKIMKKTQEIIQDNY